VLKHRRQLAEFAFRRGRLCADRFNLHVLRRLENKRLGFELTRPESVQVGQGRGLGEGVSGRRCEQEGKESGASRPGD
jgi:hypothetical protein